MLIRGSGFANGGLHADKGIATEGSGCLINRLPNRWVFIAASDAY